MSFRERWTKKFAESLTKDEKKIVLLEKKMRKVKT